MNQNGELVSPYGSIGYRWGETGRWNLENKEGQHNGDVDLTLSLKGSGETASVGLTILVVMNTLFYRCCW